MFTLRRKGYPDLTISMDGAPAYGVIFWDSGAFSSVEPVFRPLNLEPDSSREFGMTLNW